MTDSPIHYCQDISNRQQKTKGAWGSHVQSEALKAKASAAAARAAIKADSTIEMGSKLAVKAAGMNCIQIGLPGKSILRDYRAGRPICCKILLCFSL